MHACRPIVCTVCFIQQNTLQLMVFICCLIQSVCAVDVFQYTRNINITIL